MKLQTLQYKNHVHFTVFTSISRYSHPFYGNHIHFTVFTSISRYSHPFYGIHIHFTVFTSISRYLHPFYGIHIHFIQSGLCKAAVNHNIHVRIVSGEKRNSLVDEIENNQLEPIGKPSSPRQQCTVSLINLFPIFSICLLLA